MQARDALGGLSLGRVAIGAALTAAPQGAGRRWIGADAGRASAGLLIRLLGVRDLAVGAGTLLAARRGDGLRPWVLAGVLADAVDAAACAAAGDALPRASRIATIAIAGAAALGGLALVRAVD